MIRNGKGEVLGLYPLMPNHIEVGRNKQGGLLRVWLTLGLLHGCGAGEDVDRVDVV